MSDVALTLSKVAERIALKALAQPPAQREALIDHGVLVVTAKLGLFDGRRAEIFRRALKACVNLLVEHAVRAGADGAPGHA